MNIILEYYRNPMRLELVRHVVPLLIFVFFIAVGLGYAWARAAYTAFTR
jgi:NADH:ubiquinone oxidoreductase subunit 3 (subunit A)